jgi:hypothetical protein
MAEEAGGARLAVSTIAPEDLVVIEKLAHGPLYRFADWPNASVPMSAIGPLLSAAGRSIHLHRHGGQSVRGRTSGQAPCRQGCGLRDRLRSHATGRRSCDQFCARCWATRSRHTTADRKAERKTLSESDSLYQEGPAGIF